MFPINLASLAQRPDLIVEAETNNRFRLAVKDIPLFGSVEIIHLVVTGPKDEDKDGWPEFMVDLDLGGRDVFHEDIELDPELLAEALKGDGGSTFGLFQAVIDGMKAKGLDLPFID